jgi:hypothetical protein
MQESIWNKPSRENSRPSNDLDNSSDSNSMNSSNSPSSDNSNIDLDDSSF